MERCMIYKVWIAWCVPTAIAVYMAHGGYPKLHFVGSAKVLERITFPVSLILTKYIRMAHSRVSNTYCRCLSKLYIRDGFIN